MSSMNCKMSARPVLKQGFLPALEAASWQAVPEVALLPSVPAVLTPSAEEISACRGSAANEDMANFVVCCCCCEDLALS